METRLPCHPTRGSLTSPSYLARNRTLGPPLEYIKRIIESRFIQFKRKNFLGIFKEIYWLWNALLILLNCLLHNLLSFSYIPEMSQQASFLPPPFLSLFLPCLILLSLPSFLCAQFYLTFNPVFSFLCCNSYFFFNLFIFN